MSVGGLVIGFLLFLSFLGWSLSFFAGRLDRLHHRVETSWAALDAALQRRAGVALELASSGLLDPASGALLAAAAHEAREAHGNRVQAETDLSWHLQLLFLSRADLEQLAQDRHGEDLVHEVEDAVSRVQLAHSFHTDAVTSTRKVRQKKFVRLFRLAGSASVPTEFPASLDIVRE
ncbi:MAG TPA: NUDIX hydrolase [Candidatus Nanopelagicaceae bacterium]|nr:NUDIX hydrolase [Candidatus Nanopelagicaceae bacterium]